MPKGGSKPGERRGGRKRGIPNKATIERLLRGKIAEQVAEEIGAPGTAVAIALEKAASGRRLAKDELEEVVPIIKGIVAHHQQQVTSQDPATGRLVITPQADLSDLKGWLQLFVDTCFKLADFQSPKFRAIVVAAAPQETNQGRGGADNVIPLNDPVGAARVYKRIVSAGTRR
jgi:Na+-transporting methylmalonyl-CoA/oxaloacetate decarboxylase gamma subunit